MKINYTPRFERDQHLTPNQILQKIPTIHIFNKILKTTLQKHYTHINIEYDTGGNPTPYHHYTFNINLYTNNHHIHIHTTNNTQTNNPFETTITIKTTTTQQTLKLYPQDPNYIQKIKNTIKKHLPPNPTQNPQKPTKTKTSSKKPKQQNHDIYKTTKQTPTPLTQTIIKILKPHTTIKIENQTTLTLQTTPIITIQENPHNQTISLYHFNKGSIHKKTIELQNPNFIKQLKTHITNITKTNKNPKTPI